MIVKDFLRKHGIKNWYFERLPKWWLLLKIIKIMANFEKLLLKIAEMIVVLWDCY